MTSKKQRDFIKWAQEKPNIYDENGNFVDWKKHFREKEEWLSTNYEEEKPLDFVKEVLLQDHLDTHKSKEELLPLVAFMEGTGQDEGLHSGKGTGIVKYTMEVDKKGKPIQKTIAVYDDFRGIELTQNNRFALINLCSYFGRNIYRKDGETGKFERVKTRVPSECFGLAIDLDYVTLKQLQNLVGKFETELAPYPTYIVNSGAGLHLYYLFEQPIELKDLAMQRYLGELKKQLIELVWTRETSLSDNIQRQGIYQDMRVPGSWTKFGYKNKERCTYIIRAYKVGERVDFTYLEDFCDREKLPKVEDEGSTIHESLSLEKCAELYPKWYERVVIRGEKKRQNYTQRRGLYEWWKNIMTKKGVATSDTTHDGNRYFCMRVLFVMAKKSGVDFEEAMQDAIDLIPFLNSKPHGPENEFTLDDVKAAARFYEDEYVTWSNKTIQDQTGIDISIYIESRASRTRHREIVRYVGKKKYVGRTRKENLERARALRPFSSYENVGRPKGSTKEEVVREWREANPQGRKCECVKELGLDKKTVAKWWE